MLFERRALSPRLAKPRRDDHRGFDTALTAVFDGFGRGVRRDHQDGKIHNVRHLVQIRVQRMPEQFARVMADEMDRTLISALDEVARHAVAEFFRRCGCTDDNDALWIEVDTSLPAERVVRVLENLLLWRAAPKQIRMDNGPELISQRLERWAKEKQIELLHIQPGKPAQNAYIERFNRTYREEVLDAYLFDDLEEVRLITERWLEEYNTIRPHEALQGLPPRQYAIQNA